jgi:hypothetical protein
MAHGGRPSGGLLADLEVGHLLQRAHHSEWSQPPPPWAAQALNSSWAVAVLGSDTPSWRRW